ncbi:MAG TPA: DNA polymerase III subunit beta [Acidiferrobacterales bacterium]|nr:DNA polymerase III subunit beta [Acidiferrobacterales bacterium]
MRINIEREELLKPLALVAGVVERRQTLPVLSNALLRFDGKTLTLTGTDLEVEVITRLFTSDGEQGEITIPARKLLDICRALPPHAKIEIKQGKEKVAIKSGNSRFTLLTLPTADFPNIETVRWEQTFVLPQKLLKELLEKTHFCMAQQDVRYYLNGLLLELLAPNQLWAVATDGHRLALGKTTLDAGINGEKQIIIPRKGVQEIIRFLEDTNETAEVQLSSNHLRINLKELTFTSKLIDGRFPDYNKVIPAAHTKQIILSREQLHETLSRVAILSNDKYRGAQINLSAGAMKITAHNPEQEEAEEELAITYRGENLEIGFNINYLIEAVTALGGEAVEVGLTDPNSSCTLSTPGDKKYLYIVMPMRL